MITNEEFQSKLEEILQRLQELEQQQHSQWNEYCQQGLKGVSLAVDRGISDTLGKNQQLLIEAIEAEDFDLFTQEVQKFTSSELVKMYKDVLLKNDFNYMLWSTRVSWGFQVHWAHLQVMAPEEIKVMKETSPYTDTEIPENFDSSIPLNQVKIWAPQDHMTRVQS